MRRITMQRTRVQNNLQGKGQSMAQTRFAGTQRRTAMMRIFVTAMLAGTAMAQVNVPTLGYLPDQGTIRTMKGIPASASIGPLLSAGQTFTQIAVSPSGAFALASTSSGEVDVLTVAADGATLQTATVQGAAAGNLQLSPNGSSALISNGGALQVIGGLPASPAVVNSTDVSYLGTPSALAVSDDAQWAAGVFGGVVNAIGLAGVVPLPAPAGVTAIAFFHGSDDLAATTAVQIVQISNIGGTPTASTIFGSADTPAPPESPIALALTSDNASVVLMEPDGGIGQVQLANGAVSVANCGCKPEGLSGLGGALFRLNALANGSVKIYDASSGDVWFVPLPSSGAQGGQQ
jgi:hypothetical protein